MSGRNWSDGMFKRCVDRPVLRFAYQPDTAENIARRYHISREEQDGLAVASQNKCEAARNCGRFRDEITAVRALNGALLEVADENPRNGVSAAASLSRLKPVQGCATVTAGNSSGIADGAAAIMLMTRQEADRRRLDPMAVIVSWSQAGVDPSVMGIGPVPASRKALDKAGWTVDDLDLIEANESFAAQAIYVNREMRWGYVQGECKRGEPLPWAIPLAHRARVFLTTLLGEMLRRNAKKALATLVA